MVEGQFEDGLRLAGIVKGGDGRLEPLQVLQQQGFGRRGLAGRCASAKRVFQFRWKATSGLPPEKFR